MNFQRFIAIFSVAGLNFGGTIRAEPIRRMDCSEAPEMEFMAQRARQIGDAVYPQIVDLLAAGNSHAPQHLDIVFRRHLLRSGYALRNTAVLNADFLAERPEMLDFLLVHELAHVAQSYPNLPYPHAWQWYAHYFGFELTHFRRYPSFPPEYWAEGIADYVCNRLGYFNPIDCAECAEIYPSYADGYGCAAALLLFIDTATGADVTLHLNSALRQGIFTNGFFANLTGESIDQWWSSFQKTDAFRPIAADFNQLDRVLEHDHGENPRLLLDAYFAAHPEIREFFSGFTVVDKMEPDRLRDMIMSYLYYRQRPGGPLELRGIEASVRELHRALAFTNGVPPPDLAGRIELYLRNHPDIQEWCDAHQWLDKPGAEIPQQIEKFFLMRMFPGANISISAYESLARLKRHDQLPGLLKAEPVKTTIMQPVGALAEAFPAYRWFDCQTPGSKVTYHYRLRELSNDAGWELKDAWMTDARGRVADLCNRAKPSS